NKEIRSGKKWRITFTNSQERLNWARCSLVSFLVIFSFVFAGKTSLLLGLRRKTFFPIFIISQIPEKREVFLIIIFNRQSCWRTGKDKSTGYTQRRHGSRCLPSCHRPTWRSHKGQTA